MIADSRAIFFPLENIVKYLVKLQTVTLKGTSISSEKKFI